MRRMGAGSVRLPSGDLVESGGDLLDMSSSRRPDLAWRFVDGHGHAHRWHEGDLPASTYRPDRTYHVPSVRWVHEGWDYYEDGERTERGHYECRDCGEVVTRGFTADATRQLVPGLQWYRINGEAATKEDVERLLAANGLG